MPTIIKPALTNPAELWANAYSHQSQIKALIEGLRMQIQNTKNKINEAGFSDSQASASCDVEQQIVTQIEKVNNAPLVDHGTPPPMPTK